MSDQSSPSAVHTYPCSGCGANVEFAPGTDVLKCPYCGHEQALAAPTREVREHSFDQLLAKPRQPVASLGANHFVCSGCGARTDGDELARLCQFCASPLVADNAGGDVIPPEAVLPFGLDRGGARDALRRWVKSRWFAPNQLKKVTEAESSKSTYVPHWTYDAATVSHYQGERGTYYYVTETYTATENGQTVTKTRQVRHTSWSPASGTVRRDFDDILVMATGRVTNDQLRELEPWPLKDARAYQPEYLAGHQALRYEVEPEQGFEVAKQQAAPVIRNDCMRDIGGDEQRVHGVDTRYSNVTYKLMLLPVWICCYVFAGKNWQVLINGVTGEVQGQRPYSVAKIIGAVAAGLAVLAVIITLIVLNQN